MPVPSRFCSGPRRVGPSLLISTMMFLMAGAVAFRHAGEAPPKQPPGDRSPASEAPTVTLDKSQFNLFNPTPEDALRPFSTARPGKTHSSLTVDAGHFQIEGDFRNYSGAATAAVGFVASARDRVGAFRHRCRSAAPLRDHPQVRALRRHLLCRAALPER